MINQYYNLIDVEEVKPLCFTMLHGESANFTFSLERKGEVIPLNGFSCKLYYNTKDNAENEWYEANGTINTATNTISFEWLPTMDNGASQFNWFVRVQGTSATDVSYRICGKFLMRNSPDFTPNEIELPRKVLNFADLQVLNAPYYTKSHIDTELEAIDLRLQGHDKEINALREEITGDAEETLKEHEENHNNPHKVKASQLTEKPTTSGGVNATTDTGATIAIIGDPLMYNEIVLSVNASGVGINITDEPLVYYATHGEAQLEFRGTNRYTIYGIEGVVFLQIYIDSTGQYTAISVGYVDDTGDRFFYGSTDYFGNTMGKLVSFDYTQSGTYQVLTEAMLRDRVTGKAYTICVENGELKLQEFRATKYEA